MTASLIIGDNTDSHVVAVLSAIAALGGDAPMLIDAPTLASTDYCLDAGSLTIAGKTMILDGAGRGWLRRYAPTTWGAGMIAGGLEAVSRRAFLSLVGSISRLGDRKWLTHLEAMLRAEDRLLQLQVVDSLGFRVPRTVVTDNGHTARTVLGDQFIVKPLLNGYYNSTDGPKAVFTSVIRPSDLDRTDFAAAPFVAQEQIDIHEHLRIVTVNGRGWIASLDATNRPMDWRQQDEAHFSWRPIVNARAISDALEVAAAFNVGYTSQVWVRDDSGLVFLDLNPGGQWLFLPNEVSMPATSAIAEFLVGAS